MNKDIFLTNSLGNEKVKFNPINPKKIGMYVFVLCSRFTANVHLYYWRTGTHNNTTHDRNISKNAITVLLCGTVIVFPLVQVIAIIVRLVNREQQCCIIRII